MICEVQSQIYSKTQRSVFADDGDSGNIAELGALCQRLVRGATTRSRRALYLHDSLAQIKTIDKHQTIFVALGFTDMF